MKKLVLILCLSFGAVFTEAMAIPNVLRDDLHNTSKFNKRAQWVTINIVLVTSSGNKPGKLAYVKNYNSGERLLAEFNPYVSMKVNVGDVLQASYRGFNSPNYIVSQNDLNNGSFTIYIVV